MNRTFAPWLIAAALAGPAAAHAETSAVTVKDAVVRAVPAGSPNTAGYMTIVNAGTKADRLLSASCACARSVEVHISHVMNGMAMMMRSGPVEIPAGGSVAFSPGGRHLMIMGLKGELKDGASQELTLKFQNAGAVKASFAVKSRVP
jgi:copper(I)-binding protein